jgi:hypothetical protein
LISERWKWIEKYKNFPKLFEQNRVKEFIVNEVVVIMGDGRRFEVFSKNVFYKYPPIKYPNILIVADGNLELSKCLLRYGYTITVYEPKPRLKSVSKTFLTKIRLIKKWFTRDENIKHIDLIVGMHPDEATVEILQWAKIHEKPFAVVPCCILGDQKFILRCHKFSDWCERLSRINKEITHREILNINGKNVMLFGHR